jgi:hypothetical protein
VSAIAPEVETHAEDKPAGDVIEKESTHSPIENEPSKAPSVEAESKQEETNTAEQLLEEEKTRVEEPSSLDTPGQHFDQPKVEDSITDSNIERQAADGGPIEESEIPHNQAKEEPRVAESESTGTEHPHPQESEIEPKIANMEPIVEMDSHGARPIPRAMPSTTRVPIETPSEDLSDEPRVFDDSLATEHIAQREPENVSNNSAEEPTQQADLHEDTHSSAGTTPVQEATSEPQLDDSEVLKELPVAEVNGDHQDPETLPAEVENVPNFEAPSMSEEKSNDEAPRQLEDEHPVDHEHSDLGTDGEETESLSVAVNQSPVENITEQPAVTPSEREDSNEEKDSESMEQRQAMEETTPKTVDGRLEEPPATHIENQPTFEHSSAEDPSPTGHLVEHSVVENLPGKDIESQELERENVSRDIEPSSKPAVHSSVEEAVLVPENVSEPMGRSHGDFHEGAPTTEMEAAMDHEDTPQENLPLTEDVEDRPMAQESSSNADAQSIPEETASTGHAESKPEPENESEVPHDLSAEPLNESTSSVVEPTMNQESSSSEPAAGAESTDNLPRAAEQASAKDALPVSEESDATQEASSAPDFVESHAADESALSPQLPPVQLDTSVAEDLSAAAHDLPSLQDETREAFEEAAPLHTGDDNSEESIARGQDEPWAKSPSADEPERMEIPTYTEPDAADHHNHNGFPSAAAVFDESHNDKEKEFDALSDGHATNTALSETPPTSLEGSFPNIDDGPLKEDHTNADGHEDVEQTRHMDNSELPHVKHEDPENNGRSVEPAEQSSPSVRVRETEIEESDNTDDEMSSHFTAQETSFEQAGLSSNETAPETFPEHLIASAPANEKSIDIDSGAPTVSDSRDEPMTEDLHTSPEFPAAQPQLSSFAEEQPNQPARPQTPTEQEPRVIDLPSTPSAQMIHQTEDHALAESPVTVVNADDLFADDDEDDEYEEQYHEDEHRDADSDLGYDGSGYGLTEAASHAELIDPVGAPSSSWPLPSGDTEKSDILDHYSHSEYPTAHTGLFASLVDTIRSDLPAVEKMIHDSNEDPHEEEYSEEESSDIEPDADSDDNFEGTPLDHIPEEEEDYHPSHDMDSSLHIRTHTADTVPSFETYAHSDEESSPSTPIDEIAERAEDALQTERLIRSSWPVQPHEVDPQEDSQDLKPQASPMHTEFDPFSTQAYPAYITPKTSQANLKGEHTPESDFNGSPGESENGHQEPARSPRFPTLNTDLETRPYDSPPSVTHSQTGDDFQPPTPTRRSTATDRAPISTSRTPVSSPSVPSNSFFQKTRSLFESSSTSQPPTPPTTRPLSGLFNIRGSGSPSPPPKPASLKSSRPSSLYQVDNPAEELIVPRSLDAVPKPPSPGFVLPPSDLERKRSSSSFLGDENRSMSGDKEVRQRSSGSFLTRLVGSGGLEDSIHNPARAPLLQNQEGNRDGEDGN